MLVDKKSLFHECNKCKKTVATSDTIAYLEQMCANPSTVDSILGMCVDFDIDGETSKALGVIEVLSIKHPQNERVAYMYTRLSGYEYEVVKAYLELFAGIKGEVAWATNLLDNTMDLAYLPLVHDMIKFANNKLPPALRKKYMETLEAMRQEYTSATADKDYGMGLIYTYYVGCSIVNIAMVVLSFFVPLYFGVLVLLVIALLGIEFFLLYLHNRIYGNRIGIGDTERLLLVIFMCSIPFVIMGSIIGWLVPTFRK